jgi:hypothetical protein
MEVITIFFPMTSLTYKQHKVNKPNFGTYLNLTPKIRVVCNLVLDLSEM